MFLHETIYTKSSKEKKELNECEKFHLKYLTNTIVYCYCLSLRQNKIKYMTSQASVSYDVT